jgi:anaerobic selenocysteine-containing dehydrogenase
MRARGIAEGELVEVFNDRGRFHAEAQVSDEVREGVVVAPLGYWASNSPNGRSANVVNASRYADLGRAPTFSDTLVQVRRVEA